MTPVFVCVYLRSAQSKTKKKIARHCWSKISSISVLTNTLDAYLCTYSTQWENQQAWKHQVREKPSESKQPWASLGPTALGPLPSLPSPPPITAAFQIMALFSQHRKSGKVPWQISDKYLISIYCCNFNPNNVIQRRVVAKCLLLDRPSQTKQYRVWTKTQH